MVWVFNIMLLTQPATKKHAAFSTAELIGICWWHRSRLHSHPLSVLRTTLFQTYHRIQHYAVKCLCSLHLEDPQTLMST